MMQVMSAPDATLAAIDGALADYTSDDAMRWSPDPERAAPSLPPAGALFRVLVGVSMEEFGRAMQHLTAAITPAFTKFSRFVIKAGHALDVAERPRWHRRHCRACNPRGFPPPEPGKFRPGPKAARIRGRRRGW